MSDLAHTDFNSYLRRLFGCRVQKISLDAGLTCPNRDGTLGRGGCIYCNVRGSGTGAAERSQSIPEQVRQGKRVLAKRYHATKFLAYFQSYSNTYAPLATLKHLYGMALADPDVVGLTIGTRPDCVSEDVLDYLADLARARLVWMEYGLQSASDATLARIRRGHTVADFSDAVERTAARNIPICAHIILGLPGEGRAEMMMTARFLSTQPIQAVKIHLLYVVRGTTLEEWYRNGDYEPLTREEYVSLVAEFLTLLPPGIIIQRLTGDPHPDELAAPLWAVEKAENLKAIQAFMKINQMSQGDALREGNHVLPSPGIHAH